jgi:hypothetical protein
MTTIHPQLATAKILGDRITAVMGSNYVVTVEDLNVQQLAKRAKAPDKTHVVVSCQECSRTVASRRRVQTGSAMFTIEISITRHTGDSRPGDFDQTQQFFDSCQAVIDAAMGIDDTHPDGTDIDLAAPWGRISWPEEVTEVPMDEELSSTSLRFRSVQFQFKATRGS